MLNNNTALLNMNMNNTDIFIDPHKSNESAYNEWYEFKFKFTKNRKKYKYAKLFIQFPRKEEPQKII